PLEARAAVQRLRRARRFALRRDGPGTDVLMPAQARRVRVWDPFVRIFHWTVVAAFVVAYFSHGGYLAVHRAAGYVLAALVVLRVVWGFAGSPHARFADFAV